MCYIRHCGLDPQLVYLAAGNLQFFARIMGIAGQARNDEWDIFQG